MIKMNRKGFTLVEIMIVVAIIGLLAAIAIPNFIRARQTAQRNACIANLKQLQGAIQVWAIDTGAASDATFTTADIVGNYLKSWPKCGTTYDVPASVDAAPVCPNSATNTDHVL
jgi:prepilin-type N-terminal cleavage/methylation domain-containing protein